MATAIHCGTTLVMDYNYRVIDCADTWSSDKTQPLFRNHPKWCDFPNVVILEGGRTWDVIPAASDVTSNTESGGRVDDARDEGIVGKRKNRYLVRVKDTKAAKQKKIRLASFKRLANAAQRKSGVHEKRNAIAYFSQPEMSDTLEALPYFQTIGNRYFVGALKKTKLE